MMIREDLENEIMKIYNSENFDYVGIVPSIYGGVSCLLFLTDSCKVGVFIKKNGSCELIKIEKYMGLYRYSRVDTNTLELNYNGENTILTYWNGYGSCITKKCFKGKAFDFDKEAVIIALEGK